MKKTTIALRCFRSCKWLHSFLLLLPAVASYSQDTTLKGFAPYPFGASISAPRLKDDAQYRAIATREYNSITPENAMKFAMIHPSQNTYTWADADTIVNFAVQHGKRVHGHTLIWNQNVPSWVTNFVGDSAAWENLMKTHIQTIVTHYKGKVTSWDVVNEAILDDGTLRNTIWLQRLGSNYIARAFQYAHEADSTAILFYNDYGHEYPANNFQRLKGIKNMVMSLVNAGVPIHGVGMQLHVTTNSYSYNIKTSIDSMIATGLKIHFSELDVSLNPYYIPTATYNDSMAAELFSKYKFFARIARTIPQENFYGITTWNVTDRDSWLPKTGNPDWPLPFDSFYQKKTAFQGIYDGATGSWDFDSSSCSSFSSTYNDLGASGTAISTNLNGNTMTYDDDNSSVQDIGFGFGYNGSVYQHFVLNTNGYIRFGRSNSGNYFYTTYNGVLGSAITGSHIDLVYPFNRDLKAGSGTPEYRVYTAGTAGNRVCTIQFKNVADKQTPVQYTNMNFQVKLYEATGAIEFIYGTWTASGNAASAITAAVGIKGILAGQSVNVAKLSGTSWTSSMTNPSNYDFTNGNYPEPVVGPAFNNRNNALPDAGRTFRFTPTTISLPCEADAYLRDGSYSSTNFGTDTLLQLKNDPGAGYSRIDYLKFIVPAQARGNIRNAKLKLYLSSTNPDANTTQWQLYRVANNSWTETGITHANRPAYGTLLAITNGTTLTGNIYWNITAALQGLTTDTISFALISTTPGSLTNADFLSKESAIAERHPELLISPDPDAPSGSLMSVFYMKEAVSPADNLVIYPNPAGCCITVASDAVQDTRSAIRIYNQNGQLVQTVESFNNRETLNIERHSPGIYYLQWMYKNRNGETRVIGRKIFKQ